MPSYENPCQVMKQSWIKSKKYHIRWKLIWDKNEIDLKNWTAFKQKPSKQVNKKREEYECRTCYAVDDKL